MNPPVVTGLRRPRVLAALALFTLLLAELHEWAHTAPGAWHCGSFGERDFNSWELLAGCTALWPTLLGPLFTFGVAYAAAAWLERGPPRGRQRALLVLIASALPARVLTAALGGGDEVQVMAGWLPAAWAPHSRGLATGGVVALSAWPLWVLWRALGRRWGLWLLWLVLPVVWVIAVVLIGLNTALAAGVLAGAPRLGSPPLVLAWAAALVALAPLAWRAARDDPQAAPQADA